MTATPRTTGRHRAARRYRWVWPVAIALVVAVGTALLGAGGTYALWNGTASTASTTVRSATATITVGSTTAMNTAALGPGTSTTGTFTVRNTGSIPMSMRVTTTASKSSVAAATGELTLHLAMVSSAAKCVPGLTGTSGRLATFDTGSGSGSFTLPAGVSGIACLEMALDADAPQAVAGATTDFTLTVTGTQVSA
jgi:hypothetical protein